MKFNVNDLISILVNLIKPLIPLIGDNALSVTERAATLPEKDIRKMCTGMAEADVVEAVRLGRKMADSISDFSVFVASRGTIKPD